MDTFQKVLLVEDNVMLRLLFRESLESFGYEVIERGDAQQVIDAWDSAETDLVITDLALSEALSGMEVVDFISRRSPGVGIVMMSGVAQRPADLRPDVGFLHKPFTDSALKFALEKAQSRRSKR